MGPKKRSINKPHTVQNSQVSMDSDSDEDFDPPVETKRIKVKASTNQTRKKTKANVEPSAKKNVEKDGMVLPSDPVLPSKPEPINITPYILKFCKGHEERPFRKIPSRILKSPLIRYIEHFTLQKTASPFDRRTTALAWHPTLLTVAVAASNGGDIVVWNYENPDPPEICFQGFGAGGSVQSLIFDPTNLNQLYTTSIDGTVRRRDLVNKKSHAVLDTNCYTNYYTNNCSMHWFTSVDANNEGHLLAGDTKGDVYLVTKGDEKPVWRKNLHRNSHKVTCIDFSRRQSSLFVTASMDKTVKVWDLRCVKDKQSFIYELPHNRSVNSAFFSPSHGTRIVTTDQNSEINVFSGPLWDLETKIPHPHRQFQHLTPFKAYWHPLEEIVLIGRYPDPKFPGYVENEPRSLDFFDASDGRLLLQLEPKGHKGLLNLNRFNPIGNALISASGFNLLLWKPSFLSERRLSNRSDCAEESKPEKMKRQPLRRKNDDDDDLKKNIKRACQTKKSKGN